MTEYRFANAIVRVHEGQRTEEERKKILIDAAQRFGREIMKKGLKKDESA